VEQLVTMKRDRFGIFAEAIFKPVDVNDSRFGIRKRMNNRLESPRIATYMNPGRGASGESSN
jgi:hypothetical protein